MLQKAVADPENLEWEGWGGGHLVAIHFMTIHPIF